MTFPPGVSSDYYSADRTVRQRGLTHVNGFALVAARMILEKWNRLMSPRLLLLLVICMVAGLGPAAAADAGQGKTIAERWCSSCHVVGPGQTSAATDQAPPFATIAKMPGFDAGKLALLLLTPHPNMPKLPLSRLEVADLAEYIRTLPH